MPNKGIYTSIRIYGRITALDLFPGRNSTPSQSGPNPPEGSVVEVENIT